MKIQSQIFTPVLMVCGVFVSSTPTYRDIRVRFINSVHKGNSHYSLYIFPLSFFPLFQNKLDFSPGSSVLWNPLETGPGSGELSLSGCREKKIHGGEWVRDKDLGSGALWGHFHSVKAVTPDWAPSRLEVCARAPSGNSLMGD